MVRFMVISDDLTGANGVAGMMAKRCGVVVISYRLIKLIPSDSECIVVNTESRLIEPNIAESRVKAIVNYAESNGFIIGKRIDSALRGNIESELRPLLKQTIVITDTIPEYGRFTENGFTILGNSQVSIVERLGGIKSMIMSIRDLKANAGNLNGVVIVNSRTMDDIIEVAQVIHDNGFTPVDPGPLNAQVAGLYVKGRLSKPTINEVKRVCFIIGSTHENTIKQVERARRSSIKVISIKDSGDLSSYDEVIITFDLMRDRDYLNEDFIKQVAQFDALVVSGGETANLLINISKANYLESIGEVMPLVGVSVIKGGLLNGKVIATKGGIIGGEDAYLIIRDYLRRLPNIIEGDKSS
ncbi:four-carbon acid sugar kinase family protein [Caldivirga sp. UBA161]|uniref:four-carbon acid sugar kinase family protein n=1 Tax=Caldivirga sp. UBA161 TaxID=1915569 RepID=UPI0025B845F3|nr:four-carbon acid sugar kinase family protein [Caldivirga sp. UBA161]